MKKAFTLIELLVVIAIIAILAAILFPVFAQAKAAAKETAAISNIKNLGTAHNIYLADSDDIFAPTVAIWGGVFTTWQEIIMPYMRSREIILHPKMPLPTPISADATANFFQRNSHFGMPLRGEASTAYVAPNGATNGNWLFGNTARTAAVTGGVVVNYQGIAGASVEPGQAWGTYRNQSSMSSTQVESPSEQMLLGESGHWDFSWGFGATMVNFYGTGMWVNPALNNFAGGLNYCGPHARKQRNPGQMGSGHGGALPAPTAVPNGIPDGLTTMVATDSSARAVPFRGGITGSIVTSTGIRVMPRLWPLGR